LPRADGKGGVLIQVGLSADGDQPVVSNIVLDGMGEADGFTIIDGRDINASKEELVDEGLVVIGTLCLGISKIKPRVRHLINVKEPHFLHFEA
jgi:hypothetical protein